MPLKPGEVVTVDFVGATGVKRRPAVVVSTEAYNKAHQDVALCVRTSNVASAKTKTDFILQDWKAAGLNAPSAFRVYFGMALPSAVKVIGHLSAADWAGVQACLKRAVAVS
jgi:mRNA interferase MazF